jgi:hypothetical protein
LSLSRVPILIFPSCGHVHGLRYLVFVLNNHTLVSRNNVPTPQAVAAGLNIAGRMICMLKRLAVVCRPRPVLQRHGRIVLEGLSKVVDAVKHASPQSRLASRLALFPSTRLPTVASIPCRPACQRPRPYNAGTNSWPGL